MKKLLSVMAMVLMAAVVAFPAAALAVPTLSLSDGVIVPIIVADGGPLDSYGGLGVFDGVVSYSGPVGGTWVINVTTGITTPALAGTSMDLNSVNVSSIGAGTLTLMFSEVGFALSGTNYATMGIGGTTDGMVTYDAYFDNTNALFGTAVPPAGLIGATGNMVGDIHGVFSGGATNNITTVNPFSLTQVVTITHQGAFQITSFDAKLDVVPIPPTALLLGTGLLGLVGLGWRRKKKS
jgi:hypothetical protein